MGPTDEKLFTAFVLFGVCGLAIYRAVVWIMEATRNEDPWGPEVDEALERQDAVPLCHHCLEPQEHNGWFCPNCGATVGAYCNYMPYVYLFTEGEVLRSGVTDRLRRSNFITIGYVLVSIVVFSLVSPLFWVCLPFYWFFLGKNLQRDTGPGRDATPVAG